MRLGETLVLGARSSYTKDLDNAREGTMEHVLSTTGVRGLRVRTTTPGPEARLVDEFLSAFHPPRSSARRLSVFREPALPSGFPDVVAVSWNEKIASAWNEERVGLSTDELRTAHLLVKTGPLTLNELRRFDPTIVLPRMQFLEHVAVVVRRGARWATAPLRRCFAVSDIVAFEAKMADWSRALEQAWLNTWFASQSYVVLPRPPRAAALDAARSRGIGIWIAGATRPFLSASRSAHRQPLSFASWLLNEWSWRAAHLSRSAA